MDDYHVKAYELLGPKPLVQDEYDYVCQVKRIALALKLYFEGGEASMKRKASELVESCRDRDPSMQKVANAIDEL